MNLRSNSGGSNGSFFAWLAILGFAAYFMESRTHFFDAPSLKGYSLGMTLRISRILKSPTWPSSTLKSRTMSYPLPMVRIPRFPARPGAANLDAV